MNSAKARSAIAIIAGLLVLLLVNLSIAGKEKLLAQGRVVYLQLAPVDPRSLMQGDYMALDFQVARAALRALAAELDQPAQGIEVHTRDGRIVVRLDERAIASFVRFEDEQPLARDEILVRYRIRNNQLKFATNAFFFQEGTGEQYQNARYGLFRVNAQGELLLTRLCDEDLRLLGSGN